MVSRCVLGSTSTGGPSFAWGGCMVRGLHGRARPRKPLCPMGFIGTDQPRPTSHARPVMGRYGGRVPHMGVGCGGRSPLATPTPLASRLQPLADFQAP